MASNTSLCGICLLQQIKKTSNHWCPQCEEALCDECREYHKLLRVTRSHAPIPISDYKSIPSFITDIQQSCIYHNEQYQQYCIEHALPICFKCINDHRKCNVTTLEKVINNVKTSQQFLDLESRLGDLLQNIDQIKKDRHSNVTKIEETKTRLVKEIRQERAEINKHLDNLEKQIIKDLDEKACQNCKTIQKVISPVKEKEILISKCQANFQKMKQYASELQTFLGINEIEVIVYENEQFLHSLKEEKRLEQLELVWKVDPVLQSYFSNLKNFGSIEMQTQTSNIEFIRTKDKQAQFTVATTIRTIEDVKLFPQKKITTDGASIRGCCISDEGVGLFTDHYVNKLLTVVASDNKLKYKMQLDPCSGFDIVAIDDKTVAITTGNSNKHSGVDIIDIETRSKRKFIKLPDRTYGITRNHDSLFVCVEILGIYKVNTLNFTSIQVISCKLPPYSYVSVFSDKIYYTNHEDNSVVCCDRNGLRVWTFTDELVLKEPEGIAVDGNGNVFVVGEKSSNVVIISSNGKHHKQLLTKDDGLSYPSAIFLDTENRKLLVANTKETAFLYNIV